MNDLLALVLGCGGLVMLGTVIGLLCSLCGLFESVARYLKVKRMVLERTLKGETP
jgi:hypothetical protein